MDVPIAVSSSDVCKPPSLIVEDKRQVTSSYVMSRPKVRMDIANLAIIPFKATHGAATQGNQPETLRRGWKEAQTK